MHPAALAWQALQGVPLALLALSVPLKRHPRRGGSHRLTLWSGWLHAGDHQHIELNLHPLFGLTLLGVTWLLGQALLPRFFPGWTPLAYWLVALAVAVMDALAALLHELGHAWVAMARGRRVSRITLYGLAAAVRRSGGPTQSGDQVLIAMAGPASHLLVASVLWAAWSVLPYDNEPLRVAAGFPALTNFVAGVFNLLPVSSLDGARAARALTTLFPRVRPSEAG
ncbi:MAG: M50 family metallopeptidase [Chloroflexota bacterium]|nr:M50 family metallopeptidase [Chloroflexota bacterium]